MYRCRPWPAASEFIRACSCGGGGALDHACHQRCSTVLGESQARTARMAGGQDGGRAAAAPTLSAVRCWPRCRSVLVRVIGGPGVLAEVQCVVDQGVEVSDGGVGAYLG